MHSIIEYVWIDGSNKLRSKTKVMDTEIRFINDEGKLFDLENTEHTMILEITEYVRNLDFQTSLFSKY